MLEKMKRWFSLLFVLLLASSLPALSIRGSDIIQPFDSKGELARYDFSTPLGQAQREWAEKCSVSIVIMGPENPLYAWFGHAAIVVRQPAGHSIMYDYGVFDNTKKGFYWDFVRGRMLYNIWATDADWRMGLEMEGGRSVEEYTLDLTPEAKFQILEFLKHNALEENNTYLYHFYKDNCATRLRDIIDAATGGDFQKWAKGRETEGTYRSWAERSLSHNPAASWFLNYVEGPEVDEPVSLWEQMYLPERLAWALKEYEPFHATRTVYQTQDDNRISVHINQKPVTNDWIPLASSLIFSLLSVLMLKRKRPGLWKLWNFISLFVLGLCGVILWYAMCFSDLDVTWFNESFIMINPLLLFGAFWVFRHPERTQKMLCVYAGLTLSLVVVKGLFPTVFVQDSMKTILLALPYYATGFLKADFPVRKRHRKEEGEPAIVLPPTVQ